MEPIMTQYVIYDHPRDYPDHFVLRRWYIYATGDARMGLEAVLSDSADDLRELIPPDLVLIGPAPNDDHSIAEVWV
jgi:hypothetical protein